MHFIIFIWVAKDSENVGSTWSKQGFISYWIWNYSYHVEVINSINLLNKDSVFLD